MIPPELTAERAQSNGGQRTQSGYGESLRQAREAVGLSVAEVAARLKIPAHVIDALEAENWSRLGAPVFVRGQLRSYARLLGLPIDQVPLGSAITGIEPTTLIARTYTPPMQRAAEQLMRRLVYIVITALIAIPVWIATRPHFGVPVSGVAPLDLPLGSTTTARGDARQAKVETRAATPIVAAMGTVPQTANIPALDLQFNADSWIEITSRDGVTIEQALVSKGQRRSYWDNQVGRVVLGNGSGVEVRKAGVIQSLTPYLRGNVVRFAIAPDGTLLALDKPRD